MRLFFTSSSALAVAAALAGCPTPAASDCSTNSDCAPARCVVVNQVGHCEGVAIAEGEGEGQRAGEGEGEGQPAGEGEGEGEGEGAVDLTPHFFRGAFVGGERVVSSAHFQLAGAVTSSRRR